MTRAPASRPVRDGARRRPRLLVVGGGTVGHLAPGFALAGHLAERGVEVLFATPGEARERAWFPPDLAPPLACPAPRRPRRRLDVPLFGARFAASVLRAHALLRRIRPGAVVGLGGWPCVPAALAARVARIPLGLLASDARAGAAVRLLAPIASRVYLAEESAAEGLRPSPRVRVTGPVLRREIHEGEGEPERFGLRPDRRTLLVTGGSLGARALNAAIVAGVEEAARRDAALARRIQVLHSVGESGAGVAEAYAALGLPAHVTPFLRAMGAAYRTAHLVVGRAGALTCAELAASATPAVLVPYPHHRDRQQYENARRLADRGAALLVEESDLTPEGVRRHVLELLEDPARLAAMAEAMRRVEGDGGGRVADDLVRWLKTSRGGAASAA